MGGSGDDSEESPQHKAETEKRELNLENKIKSFTKFLKLALVLLALFVVWRMMSRKENAAVLSRKDQASRKLALRLALQRIRDLQKKSFPSQRDEVIAAYHAYLAVMASNGYVKLDWQTPRQFVEEAKRMHAPLQSFSGDLTQCFSKVYYGQDELTSDEYVQFKKYIRRIAV